jgi:rhamnosyltransferase
METSIIIRTKNEEKWLGAVLAKLSEQTYKDFEIIIVDSGSTDRTLEIAKKFDTKILHIKPEDFSFPYALNFGCRQARAEKYFVLLSAHSLPASDGWLAEGISGFLSDKVMGVVGPMLSLPDASVWEKIFYAWCTYAMKLITLNRKYVIYRKPFMGVLGFTHSIVRRDLWERHNFDERYGLGGEDEAWARYWFEKGFKVVMNGDFVIRHSHGLGLKNFLKQYRHWMDVKPRPFRELEWRKK